MRSANVILATIVAATVVSPALAQQGGTDPAAAQALFDEAKRLLDAGSPEAACPKLEESLRLDEAIGTRFQLARCYELTHKTASAWSLYLEVAAEARSAGQTEREAYARQRAEALEPSLSKLKIVVPAEARAKGLTVKRNDVEVGPGQWGVPVPVDPGRYTVSVNAPGKRPWQVEVEIGGEGALQAVTLRRLTDQPAQPEPRPAAVDNTLAPPDQDVGGHGRRYTPWQWVGIGTAGAGVVSLGVSGVFTLMALNKDKDSGCVDGTCPDSTSLSLNKDARSLGNLATVTLVVGGVLTSAGAVLFFVPPDRGSAASAEKSWHARVGLGPGGISLLGSFQ